VVVVDAVEHHVVGQARLPVDVGGQAVCELKNWECGRKGRVAPGTVTMKALEVAVEGERDLR
jgi:hypothetical protein